MTLGSEVCGHPGRRENLSGQVWVTRSPVINAFLQKVLHVYMSCLCPGEGISLSDQGHVSFAHSQQVLSGSNSKEVSAMGIFPSHPPPTP